MRRIAFLAGFLLVLSCLTGALTSTSAQEATPIGGGLTGYPKLSVTITAERLEISADSAPAGWVILSVSNTSGDTAGVTVIGPPAGKTISDLEQMAATPAPEDMMPQFLYQAVIAGGPSDIPSGKTAEAIVHLPAGDWVVISDGDQTEARFSTADNPESVTTEPTGTATIEAGDFYFGGLDAGLPAGSQLVKIMNTGKQPHMIVMGKGPDDMTVDQVNAALARPEDATPAPGELSDENITNVPGVFLISSGQTMYMSMNLAAGTYFAICFVPDQATGQSHFMEGMITTFTVK